MKKHSNIPIFIPEVACPHQCVFCNQEKIIGTRSIPQPEDVKGIVERYLETMPENRVINIAFFGGSFTGIPVDLQEQYLREAFGFVEKGRIFSSMQDYSLVILTGRLVFKMCAYYNNSSFPLGMLFFSRKLFRSLVLPGSGLFLQLIDSTLGRWYFGD